jgi:glycosyltransferase involved in cell wall biosynthesis
VSAPGSISIALANCALDPGLDDPEAVLARYRTLCGWAGALAEAGADRVTVVQRFSRDLVLRRGAVDYRFVAERGATPTARWFWGRRMANLLRALQPDVVHVDGMVFPLFVRTLRFRLPPACAIVVQDHGGIHEGSPGFGSTAWRAFHRLGLGAADGFLFTARALAAPWVRSGIVGAEQAVHEVPESSTDLHTRPDGEQASPSLPGRPAILWVGRLDANKDPVTILDGFERVSGRLPEAHLTFVFGADQLAPQVRARAAALPALADRVHLRGALPHAALPPLYRGADLFVLGSHHEGSSFALIEALAFGVTPVVTDIPSFVALTGAGRVGALFPPGDVDALARSLERLGNAADLSARRAGVRAHFDRELSWSAVAQKALASYAAAAAARRARR